MQLKMYLEIDSGCVLNEAVHYKVHEFYLTLIADGSGVEMLGTTTREYAKLPMMKRELTWNGKQKKID